MNSGVGEIRNRVRSIATDSNVAKVTIRGVVDRPGVAAAVFEPLAAANVSVDVIVQNTSVDGATDITFTVERTDLPRALEVAGAVVSDIGAREVASSDNLAKISIVGTGMQNAPGYASRMFLALSEAGVNIEMITTSEIRITCVVDEARLADAARAVHVAFDLDRDE
jgi:aspartate kinase